MANKPFLSIFFLFIFPISAKCSVVISGLDDVLRQANNTSLINVTLKIMEEDRGFAGMPILYQKLTGNQFYIVSAISSLFEDRIDKQLKLENYPTSEKYLRNWLTEWSIQDFKSSKINLILKKNQNQKKILILDNSKPSIKLAKEFKKDFDVIYLREVVRLKPQGTDYISFVTAFDIAAHEFKRGNLSLEDLAKIATETIKASDELIIPDYAYCPKDYDPCSILPNKIQSCEQVKIKVQSICNSRP